MRWVLYRSCGVSGRSSGLRCATDVAEVAYSLSEAFAALLPHGPEYVLRATVDEAIRALIRKHAQPN